MSIKIKLYELSCIIYVQGLVYNLMSLVLTIALILDDFEGYTLHG